LQRLLAGLHELQMLYEGTFSIYQETTFGCGFGHNSYQIVLKRGIIKLEEATYNSLSIYRGNQKKS
jgi:hypothetical protein